MDVREMAALGGKGRWKGKSKEERKKIMEHVRAGKENSADKDVSNEV